MLKRITLTGADDSVNPKTLANISQIYPFVEWGILVSKDRFGMPRFPSKKWLRELYYFSTDVNLSCHLCGEFAVDFLKGLSPRGYIGMIWQEFQRVQLNHNFRSGKVLIEELFSITEQLPIILQYNKGNKPFIDPLLCSLSHDIHILHDSSGGRGSEIKDIIPAFSRRLTGYAGGLGPDNLKEQLIKIEEASGGADYWVDMETKLRTKDDRVFSLSDCVKCLDIVKEHLETVKA